MRIGFAGAGSMAAAIAHGFDAQGGPAAMLFADVGSGRAEPLAEAAVEDGFAAAVEASLERMGGSR